jgi:hypothetical protein
MLSHRSGPGDNTIVVFDRSGTLRTPRLVNDTELSPLDLKLAPNGNIVVASEWPFGAADAVSSVREYDPATGQLVRVFVPERSVGFRRPRGLRFGPGGRLYCVGEDHVVAFDFRTGSFLDPVVQLARLNGQALALVPWGTLRAFAAWLRADNGDRHAGPSPTFFRGRRPLADPGRGGQDGRRTAGESAVMLFAMVLALTIGCIAVILAREGQWGPRQGGLRGRIRDRGWDLLLLPIAMAGAVMTGGAHALIPAELGLAVLAIVFAPKLAAKLVPCGVLGLAVFGLHLARLYRDGFASQVQYVFVHTDPADVWLVLVEAVILLSFGLWLLLRLDALPARLVRALAARGLDGRRGGISVAHALLLIPVVALAMWLLGPGDWFGIQAVNGLDVALIDLVLATGTLVLIFWSRAWAATLAAAGLLVLGAYRWLIAVFGPAVPGFTYGFPTYTTVRCPPRSGATPCKARSCWPWACGWRRG